MSQSDIPGWVRLACRRWGEQKRRIWSGADWHGNKDGYASSLMGRIREEREGVGQGVSTQKWNEVFLGDGLAVQRALPGMPESPYDALHIKYVWDPRLKLTGAQKAALLKVSEAAFWEAAKRGETWVMARLDSPDSQVSIPSHKIVEGALRKARISTTTRVQSDKAPKLSFAALQRTTLSLK